MKLDIILIGGGGHCKACIDVIEVEGRFQVTGIADLLERRGEMVLNYEIIATDDDLPGLVKKYGLFLITLGQIKSSELRKKYYTSIKNLGGRIATVVSPLAHVSRYASLGEGTIVMHQAVVNAGAKVGVNCIINTKALIEHDARVGDHCHISTAAVLNGGAVVGNGSFVGSNTVLKEGVILPPYSVVGFMEKISKG